jgi:electron transfer flavoprotein alpha subunit
MVLVLVEQSEGTATDPSLQVLTLARSFGQPVHAVVFGRGVDLSRHGVAVTHVAEHPALGSYAPEAWAAILQQLADRLDASAVAGPGTERGNEVMARLAARSNLPMAANCIAVNPGPPATLTRLRWGGSLMEEARLHSSRPLITVAPHAVPIEPAPAETKLEKFTPELSEEDLQVRVGEHIGASGGGISLTEAKVVVSGGRGVGSKEGFAIIEELAGLLNAAVGCSRAVTSAGWRPHTDQVGQTGTKVAPDVYIACGISGATQHMAGLKGAKRIIAINSDSEAPIMLSADYAVIGDLKEIVPAISAEIRRVKASGAIPSPQRGEG